MTPPIFVNFLNLLVESGLPQDRIEFYLNRIKNRLFNEEDRQNLIKEVDTHIAQLDETISGMEAIVAEKQAQVDNHQKEILPYVEKIAELQPEIQKQELEDYKRELGEAEKVYLSKLENVRHQNEEKQMASLKSFLKQN